MKAVCTPQDEVAPEEQVEGGHAEGFAERLPEPSAGGPCAVTIFPESPAASGMMSAAVAARMKSAVYQPSPGDQGARRTGPSRTGRTSRRGRTIPSATLRFAGATTFCTTPHDDAERGAGKRQADQEARRAFQVASVSGTRP
jgi:hypothetical protein